MIKEALENINTDWKFLIENILIDFPNLENQLNEEEEKFSNLLNIFSPKKLIFKCFNYFNIDDLKVVIIGQDPYNQINKANGLCFSVNDNIKIPPVFK